MAPTDITLTQNINKPGIEVDVSITGDAINAIHVIFNDMHDNEDQSALDKYTIPASTWNNLAADAAGVRVKTFTLAESKYETLSEGSKVQLHVSTSGLSVRIDEYLRDIAYKQGVPFEIISVTGGAQKIVATVQLNTIIHGQNSNDDDNFTLDARLSQTYIGADPTVIVGEIDATGRATIIFTSVTVGDYEVLVTTYNNYDSETRSATASVTTDPVAVTATNFYSFDSDSHDVSAGHVDIEFADKDYSDYTNIKVFAVISQKDNTTIPDGADGVKGKIQVWASTDASGGLEFENNMPTSFMIPSNMLSTINAYNVDATDLVSKKFKLALQIVGDTILAGETSARTFFGPTTTTEFYKDTVLMSPTVTLDDIDWTTGEQTIKVVEAGKYDGYKVVYDLSGTVSDLATMDACGTTHNSSATRTYGFSDLELVNGNNKNLDVFAQRPEINHLNAVNPPMNKSQTASLTFLQAIKSAEAPTVVNFTDITPSHDGSIEFAYIEASANTQLVGTLVELPLDASAVTVDTETANIPSVDASNEIIEFAADLDSGTKYEMRANTKYNMDGIFNIRYNELNGDSWNLFSATTTQTGFFTSVPTLTLTVRPTGTTNVMGTVRMECQSNANDISKMMVYVKDVCGQILNEEVVVGTDFVDTCGNRVLNAGGNINGFNMNVVQDFVFDTSVRIDPSNTMFLLGIVDTPNSIDAIAIDEVLSEETYALNSAIDDYNTGLAAYESALDASKNYLTDATYVEKNDLYVEWTASAEALEARVTELSNNLIPTSEENVAELDSDYNLKTQKESAALSTKSSIENAVNNWNTAYTNESNSTAKLALKFSPKIEYTQFTASGEDAVDIQSETVDIPLPSSGLGYNAIYLADQVDAKDDVVTATSSAKNLAYGAKQSADAANTLLDDELDDLEANVSTTGSVDHAEAVAAAALTDRDTRVDAITTALTNAKTALVGFNSQTRKYGTALVPLLGSYIFDMNDARSALSAVVQGIEKFSALYLL